MAPQAVDDVDDPVLACARLPIGEPAQVRPEPADGEAHGIGGVIGRDAADEMS
jgi:hypothetical protein